MNACPECPHCGIQMMFACREVVDEECELLTYRCPKCREVGQVVALLDAAQRPYTSNSAKALPAKFD